MQKKEYLIIPNKKDLSLYKSYGFNTFVLPLEDYSIGFDVYFNLDEINELSKTNVVYVMINKFLHLNISKFRLIYPKFNDNIKFIVEDIGLTDVIDKDRIVLYENHIISNYKAINYLNGIGYNNIVINNDLTINEISEIKDKTNGNLYYFVISRNDLMYSRRNLVSNYNKFYNLDDTNRYEITEKVSKEKLIITEEKNGSVVKYSKIFCANKYIDRLEGLNLIINFSLINEDDEKIILDNYDNSELVNMILSDYYFLENDIKYKVGDLK